MADIQQFFRAIRDLLLIYRPKAMRLGPLAWIKGMFHSTPPSGPLRLLSFGCSDGSDVHALRNYFPTALIDGVDVNKEQIARNVETNTDQYVTFYDSVSNLTKGSYDAVLAMGVLTHMKFDAYVEAMNLLDGLLKPPGYMIVYNADYFFTEWPGSARYDFTLCGPDTFREDTLVTAVDVKNDHVKDKTSGEVDRGVCSMADKYCIESGWRRKIDKNGDRVQNDDNLFGKKEDSPVQMSQGCKFAGTLFRKLSVPEMKARNINPNAVADKSKKEEKDKD